MEVRKEAESAALRRKVQRLDGALAFTRRGQTLTLGEVSKVHTQTHTIVGVWGGRGLSSQQLPLLKYLST